MTTSSEQFPADDVPKCLRIEVGTGQDGVPVYPETGTATNEPWDPLLSADKVGQPFRLTEVDSVVLSDGGQDVDGDDFHSLSA